VANPNPEVQSSGKVKITCCVPSAIPDLHISIRHALPTQGLCHMGLEKKTL